MELIFNWGNEQPSNILESIIQCQALINTVKIIKAAKVIENDK